MELTVKEEFKDKYTGKVYKVGEKITVEKERGEELLNSPYVVVEETKNTKSTKNNKKAEKENND